ncbi:MAG TPA: lamin tail domain-containing protein [Candidatus Heimdallarchaeota archaeon]|nr:lamin tail domain-containing protein [Candidatus Heimdallarchaeota archaeon]
MIGKTRWLALLVAPLLFSLFLYGQQTDLLLVQGIRAEDGDTILVQLPDGTRQDVRYASINAPGLDQCLGTEAREYNDRLIKGSKLWLDRHPLKDGYEMAQDRLVAHVFLSPNTTQTSSVSALLVAAGLARLDVFYPNDTAIRNGDDFSVRYADLIMPAQIEAARIKRGLWGQCDSYAEADLMIAAVKQWSDDEVVYVLNRGEQPIDLAQGWILKDGSDSDRNTLDLSDHLIGECLLPPGGVLRIHSGSVATGRGGEHSPCDQQTIDFYWTGYRIWDQDKDEARLYAPDGMLIDTYTYPLDWN